MWLGHNKAEEGTEAAVASQVRVSRNRQNEKKKRIESSRMFVAFAVAFPPPRSSVRVSDGGWVDMSFF